MKDSVVNRDWIITSGTRKIAGYECTRAIWQKNDTTRIYAWYTTDIVPTLGPESVQGLPGAILGLATENGGIVYFASKVEIIDPTEAELAEPKKKGKEYTYKELYDEMVEKLEGQPFGARVLEGMFFW
jgi:GLPGLI family protein